MTGAPMTAMEDAVQQGVIKQGAATYGYYRQPNGWITVSLATEFEELYRRKEGWEPLPTYGRVEMGNTYAANHPLEALFILGGAKELCREQIIESGFHLNPPLIPVCRTRLNQYHKRHDETCWAGAEAVTFPQLEEVPAGVECRFCDRPPFPTEQARNQHEDVAHKDEKGEIRTGQVLAEALAGGNSAKPAVATQEANDPYLCGHCREGFNHPMALAKHVKREHKEGANGTREASD